LGRGRCYATPYYLPKPSVTAGTLSEIIFGLVEKYLTKIKYFYKNNLLEENLNKGILNIILVILTCVLTSCTNVPEAEIKQENNMERKTNFKIDVFELVNPIFIVGRSVRIPIAGTPECFQLIGSVYSSFFGDGTLEKIKNKKESVIQKNIGHFGICHDHITRDNNIEFTYTIGVQVIEPPNDNELPENTHEFIIKPGYYARIHVSAPSSDAEGIAWMELNKWIQNSEEWYNLGGEYEVYFDDTSGWKEFELWYPIGQK
jgi:predicted transcriptional regulator YdeE